MPTTEGLFTDVGQRIFFQCIFIIIIFAFIQKNVHSANACQSNTCDGFLGVCCSLSVGHVHCTPAMFRQLSKTVGQEVKRVRANTAPGFDLGDTVKTF